MDEHKAKYEELENELNEYKELLWQLSEEYKTNVTAAEKKAEEETEKRILLEKELSQQTTAKTDTSINSLGLPACILDNNGKIVQFNNKFKFLVELLFLEIDEISTIQGLLAKDNSKKTAKNVSEYLAGDKSLYQCIYRAENSFQKEINLILRIYRNENNKEHLALFVELHKQELESIKNNEPKEIVSTQAGALEQTNAATKNDELQAEIKSYVRRYELSMQLLNFINKKLNDKTENITLIREIYNKIEKVFNLKKETKDILRQLNAKHKTFVTRLKKQQPKLTANEIKQCVLIRSELTYKEIAAVLEISVNGVKIARNRLRKKLGLDAETKTSEFIMSI